MRMAVAGEEILVGAADRADQQLVAHRPAVDEEILVAGGGAVERGEPGEAAEPHTLARRRDRQRIVGEVAAENGGEPRAPRRPGVGACEIAALGGKPQQHAILVADDGEGDRGIGHGEAPHGIDRLVALAARGLHEFESRRRRIEEVAHLDPRALGLRRRQRRALGAALDGERPGLGRATPAAGERQAGSPPRSRAAPRRGIPGC